MNERGNDEPDGRDGEQQPSPVSRLDSLSRRDLLKLAGTGIAGGGAAYAGYTLIDDEDGDGDEFHGSTGGFSWDQTFTDTSWVTTAGDDLNVETVTTLDPTGSGSLTEAMDNATGQPTVIVFEVGGVIDIERLGTLRVTDSKTWLAGETAPDPTLYVCAMDRGMGAAPPATERFEIIVDALRDAIRSGATAEQLTRAVALAAARRVASVLPGLTAGEVQQRLSAEGRRFTYIKHNLTPRQKERVNALGIIGLEFEDTEKRLYPQGRLAAHVLGLTDVDNQGIAGVEKSFDDRLRSSDRPLALSLDVRVQNVLREELGTAMERFSAKGAAGMVMDVTNGEVVALASLPDYDANNGDEAKGKAAFNRVSLGTYEMGSTFKLFNTAMALDSGVARLTDRYDTLEPVRIARYAIRDLHEADHRLNVAEILMHSSNIGSARMAREVGTERQRAFLKDLGMLREASLEVPERGRPQAPSPWREINTLTISYGHGIAVTPLHVVSGVAALINGGVFRPATLLHDPNAQPAGHRVVSPETSRSIRKLMRLVVTEGTGGKAGARGYLVGGKTGTADKSGQGGYGGNGVLTSFVGGFPMHDPRYVVLAMLDEPQGIETTYNRREAGWNAAPVVGAVVRRAAPMLDVRPVIGAPAAGIEASLELNLPGQPTPEKDLRLASW